MFLSTAMWLQQRLRKADRLAILSRLASVLAHELGSPLNVISGRAGLIAQNADATDFIRKNAEVITKQAQSMTQIIQRILDFARRYELDWGRRPVSGIIDQALDAIRPIAEPAGVTFEVTAVEDAGACEVDMRRMFQVLTTLLLNAVEAMADGGTIRVSAMLATIDEPPDPRCAPGEYVVVEVADEGVGLSPERVQRLFDPFYSTRPQEEGRSLGLLMCEGLMRESRGFLTVESELGQGSRFLVHVPTFTSG